MSKKTIRSILAIVFARLIVNMCRRFPYPFVAAIGASFQVSAGSIQNVIALTNGSGLLSPLLGTLSEHYGRKAMMVSVVMMMSAMSLIGALFADYGVFVVVMFSFGIGKFIYDPTVLAYLGDVIHFRQRARVIGICELSWALALVIGAPLAGFLLDASSLQAVFLFLAAALAAGAATLWVFVESDRQPRQEDRSVRATNPLAAIGIVSRHRPAVAALLFSICLTVSHEMFFINYGLWMEESFDLALTALGAVTIVIAIGEVIGEFIVIALADRLGPKLTSMTAMLMAAFCFGIIPLLSFSLPLAMFGILVLFICIETAIVASLPLFTEILPQSRAVMMSANMGAHSLGRLIGAAVGGLIYAGSGGSFLLVGLVAGSLGLIGFIVMQRFVLIGK